MNLIISHPVYELILNKNLVYYNLISDKNIWKFFKQEIYNLCNPKWLDKYRIYITLIQLQGTYMRPINLLKT